MCGLRHYVVTVRFNGRGWRPNKLTCVLAYSAEDAITQINANAHDVTWYEGTQSFTRRSSEAVGVEPLVISDMRIGDGWG